jgi:hypothetical protein
VGNRLSTGSAEGGSKSIQAGLHFEQSAYLSTTVAPPAIRAMCAYVAATERDGSPALADAARRMPWSEGTVVDLLT